MNTVAVMGMVGLSLVALLAGWWLGRTSAGAALAASQQRAKDLESRNTQQEGEIQGLRKEKDALEKGKTRSEEQLKAAQQALVVLAQARNDLADTFKALAADALQNTNKQFLALATEKFEAKQQAIDTLLKPVKETLVKLDEQTRHLESKREGAYKELGQQLLQLDQDQKKLQQAATALSSALRDTRTTGKWGEIVLRRVVELAGMTEHCDFTQQHTQDENRPDMIVHLPNGRKIIVDAKTSISSFLDAADAQDETMRQQKLKEHARNIRAHALGLAKRRYEKTFEDAIDLTVCFIPGDVYYYAALQVDPGLFEVAANEKIIFATPTTLIALLKAAAFGWQQDLSGSKAKEIVKQAQEVYDRLTTATGHLSGLGSNLSKSIESYDKLIGSLERSVFPAAREMRKLGIGGNELPPIKPLHETTRQLKAKDWQMQGPSEGHALAAGASDETEDGPTSGT
jgi:DNA recombination protein RmuC